MWLQAGRKSVQGCVRSQLHPHDPGSPRGLGVSVSECPQWDLAAKLLDLLTGLLLTVKSDYTLRSPWVVGALYSPSFSSSRHRRVGQGKRVAFGRECFWALCWAVMKGLCVCEGERCSCWCGWMGQE